MKKTIAIVSVVFCALFATAAVADTAQEVIVGLSPFDCAAESTNHVNLLQQFLLRDAPNNSHIVVWDAWELRIICDVTLPKFAYDSAAARAPHIVTGLTDLKRWCAKTRGTPTATELKDSSAIKIPEWIRAATARPAAGSRVIIVLASPLALLPDEPSLSMIDTRFPSDAHLAADPAQTIYSIAGSRARLEKTVVLWAYPSENIWASARHRELITRWWSLYISGQSGVLSAFDSDVANVFRVAVRGNMPPVGTFSIDPNEKAVVMRRAFKREVPVAVPRVPAPEQPKPMPAATSAIKTQPQPIPVVAIATPPQVTKVVAPAPAPMPLPQPEKHMEPTNSSVGEIAIPAEIPKPATGNIGIAAVWSGNRGTDIDLWVGAAPNLPEACWRHPNAPHVTYFRDIRNARPEQVSGAWQSTFEYVEIKQGNIDDATVWLNVYESSGPVEGIVRVQFNGKVVDRPFHFNVTSGNHGLDSKPRDRSHSACWQRVNLTDFFPSETTQPSYVQQ